MASSHRHQVKHWKLNDGWKVADVTWLIMQDLENEIEDKKSSFRQGDISAYFYTNEE